MPANRGRRLLLTSMGLSFLARAWPAVPEGALPEPGRAGPAPEGGLPLHFEGSSAADRRLDWVFSRNLDPIDASIAPHFWGSDHRAVSVTYRAPEESSARAQRERSESRSESRGGGAPRH